MENLSASEQRSFQNIVERQQMKDMMQMYQTLVQRCFDHCINDFTSKAVSNKEETCVNRCLDKFFKANDRLTQRFTEQNQEFTQGAMGRQ